MRLRAAAVWAGLAALALGPVVLAAFSPYLAWRGVPYILGGFAGIVGLALLLPHPLLAAGDLPGARGAAGRRWHRLAGWAIVLCVGLHVGGLFVTSPPDTIDALLLVSPTPFSVYGVVALWATVGTAALVLLRGGLGLRYRIWRGLHNALALVLVVATVVHALQIEGAMEPASKWLLCGATLGVTVVTLFRLRVVRPLLRWRTG